MKDNSSLYNKKSSYTGMYEERLKEYNKNYKAHNLYLKNIYSNSNSNSNILEIGCGTGGLTKYIIKKRPCLKACDFSHVFIDKAKKENKEFKKIFSVQDCRKTSFTKNEFSIICFADVIEHVVNMELCIKEMKRILKKSGFVVLRCPNLYCNLFSTNYHITLFNILKKIKNCFIEWFKHIFNLKPALKTIDNYKLDVIYADDDAVNIISPFDLIYLFKKKEFKLVSYTSFSLVNFTLFEKVIYLMFNYLPFFKYLGGRMEMVFINEK